MNSHFTIILYVVEESKEILTFCIVAIFREKHSEWNDWEKVYLFFTWLEFRNILKVKL